MEINLNALKKSLEVLKREAEFYSRKLANYRSDFIFSFLAAEYYDIQKIIESYNSISESFNEYSSENRIKYNLEKIGGEISSSTPVPLVCSNLKEIARRCEIALEAFDSGNKEIWEKMRELKLEADKLPESMERLRKLIYELTENQPEKKE